MLVYVNVLSLWKSVNKIFLSRLKSTAKFIRENKTVFSLRLHPPPEPIALLKQNDAKTYIARLPYNNYRRKIIASKTPSTFSILP